MVNSDQNKKKPTSFWGREFEVRSRRLIAEIDHATLLNEATVRRGDSKTAVIFSRLLYACPGSVCPDLALLAEEQPIWMSDQQTASAKRKEREEETLASVEETMVDTQAKRAKADRPSDIQDLSKPRYHQGSLYVDGRWVAENEFLHSMPFKQHLMKLNYMIIGATAAIDPFYQGYMSRPLQEWQVIGQEKLYILAQSSFCGGFLADPVGLGKITTALLAALRVRRGMSSAWHEAGPILVVTTASCVEHWREEVTKQFEESRRPSVLLLTSNDLATTVLKYDIVVCSYDFVRSQYGKLCKFNYDRDLLYGKLREFDKEELQLPSSPLYSNIYSLLNREFSTMIVDDCHTAKNPNCELIAALQHLKVRCVFLLSGAPKFDNYVDLYGPLSLLPGSPFLSHSHFLHFFYPNSYIQGGQENERKKQKVLLEAVMVAREKSIYTSKAIFLEAIRLFKNLRHLVFRIPTHTIHRLGLVLEADEAGLDEWYMAQLKSIAAEVQSLESICIIADIPTYFVPYMGMAATLAKWTWRAWHPGVAMGVRDPKRRGAAKSA
ncbi:P-loop containing nucleoside triphosphate hydrolase protein [Triangularia verruculosa]|uniref:P-loop containing nucleoside triphosphate hydrolase protein n=1 Tax=Triangularia verruculosa TaxID=2587418 RepID=A0AAN6XBZ1_9PEZI|nr:P-loop containing nucleoside triphosphate hydrolase protein [Triangularia verruculosa]